MTLTLIDSLKREIQKYNEQLAEIFPERVLKLSDANLSIVWSLNVNKLKTRIRKGSSINQKALLNLEEGLKTYLTNNLEKCYHLINSYRNKEIDALNFIKGIKIEVAKHSSLLEIEDKEFSSLFFGNEKYLTHLRQKIENSNHPQHNSNYKLSLAQLNNFKTLICQMDRNPTHFINIIKNYLRVNQKLREYSSQQYNIINAHIFDEIDTVDKAYWFGFLCADGSLIINSSEKYEISLELSFKDKNELIKYAKFVGFNPIKIKDRYRFLKYKDGKIKCFKMSMVRFLCKPMGQALLKNGKFGSKSEDIIKRVPEIIKKCMNDIETENIGLGWLLGYFDGDGTIHRDRKGKKFAGEIISSSKALLNDIKDAYNIKHSVGFKDKNQNTYRLSLGTYLYKKMMSIYPNSMERKRAD